MTRCNRRKGFTPLNKSKRQERCHYLTGFTLIELIMTIVVVGIVSIPLSLLLSQHIQSSFQSEDLTITRQLARLEMEKVNNMSFASIATANFDNYEGYNYHLDRTVTPVASSGGESLIRITVEVTRQDDDEVLISLITYIVDNITIGI